MQTFENAEKVNVGFITTFDSLDVLLDESVPESQVGFLTSSKRRVEAGVEPLALFADKIEPFFRLLSHLQSKKKMLCHFFPFGFLCLVSYLVKKVRQVRIGQDLLAFLAVFRHGRVLGELVVPDLVDPIGGEVG